MKWALCSEGEMAQKRRHSYHYYSSSRYSHQTQDTVQWLSPSAPTATVDFVPPLYDKA